MERKLMITLLRAKVDKVKAVNNNMAFIYRPMTDLVTVFNENVIMGMISLDDCPLSVLELLVKAVSNKTHSQA